MSDFITVAELRIEAERLCDENERLQAENDRLREMLADDNEELAKMQMVIDYLYSFAKTCGVDAEDMRELGIEVDSKTDATRTALLPCPFCGGEARIVTAVGESWALCDKCKASTEMYATEQSAIAAWNRRAES